MDALYGGSGGINEADRMTTPHALQLNDRYLDVRQHINYDYSVILPTAQRQTRVACSIALSSIGFELLLRIHAKAGTELSALQRSASAMGLL
jgi:hypothetical protein